MHMSERVSITSSCLASLSYSFPSRLNTFFFFLHVYTYVCLYVVYPRCNQCNAILYLYVHTYPYIHIHICLCHHHVRNTYSLFNRLLLSYPPGKGSPPPVGWQWLWIRVKQLRSILQRLCRDSGRRQEKLVFVDLRLSPRLGLLLRRRLPFRRHLLHLFKDWKSRERCYRRKRERLSFRSSFLRLGNLGRFRNLFFRRRRFLFLLQSPLTAGRGIMSSAADGLSQSV